MRMMRHSPQDPGPGRDAQDFVASLARLVGEAKGTGMLVTAARVARAEPGARSRVSSRVNACVGSVLICGLPLGVPVWPSRHVASICAAGSTPWSRRLISSVTRTGSANVEQLRARVENFQDGLAQLDAVAEGRLDTSISTLRANLDELRQALADAGDQARETAQPLVEDSVDDVAQSWAALRAKVEAECG